MKRVITYNFILLAILLLSPLSSLSQKTISGNIIQDETWGPEDSPIKVSGNFRILKQATLTILPGTEIQLAKNAGIIVEGKINAIGSSENNILFTKEKNETSQFSWASISFENDEARSVLKHCDIQYSGISNRAPLIVKSTYTPYLENISFENNRFNLVELAHDGRKSLIVDQAQVQYLSLYNIRIPIGEIMILSPGIKLSISPGRMIEIEGKLLSIGTPDSSISITVHDPNNQTQTFFAGILFDNSNEVSEIKHTHIEGGGNSSVTKRSLMAIKNSNLVIEASKFENSRENGISIEGNSTVDLGFGAYNSDGKNWFKEFSAFTLRNYSNNNISARNNCWNSSIDSLIEEAIYDKADDDKLGEVDYSSFIDDCQPKPPATPNLISPLNNSKELPISPALKWKTVAHAATYKLEIATNTEFSNVVESFDNHRDTIYAPLKLTYKTKYYWRVAAKNQIGISNWSEVFSFSTYDTSKPQSPAIISPKDGSSYSACSLVLEFEEDLSYITYNFQITTDSLFKSIYLDSLSESSIIFINNLSENQNYFIRVRAENRNGFGEWSQRFAFRTEPEILIGSIKEEKIIAAADMLDDSSFEYLAFINGNLQLINSDFSSTISMTGFKADSVFDLSIVDLNNDNKKDLIISYFDGEYRTSAFLRDSLILELHHEFDFYYEFNLDASDLHNDQYPELIIAGKDINGNPKTFLYENDSLGIRESTIWFEQLSGDKVNFEDIDNDGDKDILYTGINYHGNHRNLFYLNDNDDFNFYDIIYVNNHLLIALKDLNEDGKPDIISRKGNILYFHLNNFPGFQLVQLNLPLQSEDEVLIEDLNFDNNFDILISNDDYTIVYFGEELFFSSANATELDININSIELIENNGMAAITYNKDNHFRIIQTNFCNEIVSVSKPENLRHSYNGNKIILEWSGDKHYLYDLYIQNESDYYIRTPKSNESSILTRVNGELLSENYYEFTPPSSGRYKWSVRAIAPNGLNSEFSNIESLLTSDMIPNPPISWQPKLKTGSNTTILYRELNNINSPITLEYGDALGVFYRYGDSLICGGYSQWFEKNIAITAWGDNLQTDIKEGFAANENYVFKLWKSDKNIEFPVSIEFESGYSYFKSDTISVIASISMPDSLVIPLLAKRWNMISTYLSPYKINHSSSLIIRDVNYKSNVFSPELLGSSSVGYELFTEENDTLIIFGSTVNSINSPVIINGGSWYLLPVLSKNPISLDSLNSGNIIAIKDMYGNKSIPQLKIDEINYLEPSKSYKVFLKNTDTITYYTNFTALDTSIETKSYDDRFYKHNIYGTGSNMIISLHSNEFREGDEVGVFSSNGKLVGIQTITKDTVSITIWGDNPNTSEKEGAAENEKLKLEYRSNFRNAIDHLSTDSLKSMLNDSTHYGFSFLRDEVLIGEAKLNEVNSINENKLNIISIYPNPVEDYLYIEILDNEIIESIMIFDIEGNFINYKKESNRKLNLSSISSGVYHIEIITNKNKYSKKIIKL